MEIAAEVIQQGGIPNQESILRGRIKDLEDLLRWVAPLIQVRDANGRLNPHMCLLCTRLGSRRAEHNGHIIARREPCRHLEIYDFLGE